MKSWEVEEMARKEGYHDGFDDGTEKMSQLILRLTEAGRSEDIGKCASDAEYRKKLFEEFDL